MKRIHVFDNKNEGAKAIAPYIATLVKHRLKAGRPVVLGLATGAAPVGVYQELVSIHKNKGLSFKNVITYDLDEYYPIQPPELYMVYAPSSF